MSVVDSLLYLLPEGLGHHIDNVNATYGPFIWIPGTLATAMIFTLFAFARSFGFFQVAKNLLNFTFAVILWRPVTFALATLVGVYYKLAILQYSLGFWYNLSIYSKAFLVLIVFKFFKVIVHLITYQLYRPYPVLAQPTVTANDLTVLIPTIGDFDEEFQDCLTSILACNPRQVIIITVGHAKMVVAQNVIDAFADPRISLIEAPVMNKRIQLSTGFNLVQTRFIAFADDHVFWPSTFLQSALAPFEDPQVGHIGTVKRVNRGPYNPRNLPGVAPLDWSEDILNFIATIYLERHNYECTASIGADGGMFVVSGRTALVRASIVQDPNFVHAFQNDYFLGSGPMNVDDDNFITRYMVKNGFKTFFQNEPRALMATTLGTVGGYVKFANQIIRWARTTVRSNTVTLLIDTKIYRYQPWSVYAVYFSALVNFALFWDIALFFLLGRSQFRSVQNYMILFVALFLSKMIKPFGHYWRNPGDLKYAAIQLLFGYFHSFVKLAALFTCFDVRWTGRNLADAAAPHDNPPPPPHGGAGGGPPHDNPSPPGPPGNDDGAAPPDSPPPSADNNSARPRSPPAYSPSALISRGSMPPRSPPAGATRSPTAGSAPPQLADRTRRSAQAVRGQRSAAPSPDSIWRTGRGRWFAEADRRFIPAASTIDASGTTPTASAPTSTGLAAAGSALTPATGLDGELYSPHGLYPVITQAPGSAGFPTPAGLIVEASSGLNVAGFDASLPTILTSNGDSRCKFVVSQYGRLTRCLHYIPAGSDRQVCSTHAA